VVRENRGHCAILTASPTPASFLDDVGAPY
jgi:hypothetical protein